MKHCRLFFFILLASSSTMAAEKVLLVVGDSLSAAYGIDRNDGWVALLQQRLDRADVFWKVVNAGISGDTTAGGVSRLPALLERHHPSVVVIELGSNDGLRGFAFDQIESNLERMIQLTRRSSARPVLVGGMIPPNYGAAYAEAFHQVFKDTAERLKVPLVPFLLDGVAQDRSLMLADGYHPNEAGQARMLDNIWLVLEQALDDMADL